MIGFIQTHSLRVKSIIIYKLYILFVKNHMKTNLSISISYFVTNFKVIFKTYVLLFFLMFFLDFKPLFNNFLFCYYNFVFLTSIFSSSTNRSLFVC